MKARTASVPDTLLRIAAVTGSLALLPGMTFGTSAHESPNDDGAVAGAAAAAAFDLVPCMSAGVAAAAQQHRGDPGVPMCPDENGEMQPCGAEQLLKMCEEAANYAYEECREDAGFWGRQGCKLERAGTVMACAINYLEEILTPFNT